jgi:hypothetical protein
VTVPAIAIATDRAVGFRPRQWAVAGFWVGGAVSVLTNWLATSGGIVNHGVSAFPALAFLLAVESLSSKPRAAKPSTIVEVSTVTERQPITATPSASDVMVEQVAAPSVTSKGPRRSHSAAVKVRAAAKRMPDATPAQAAAKAGVSESRARRHLATTTEAATKVKGHAVPALVPRREDL